MEYLVAILASVSFVLALVAVARTDGLQARVRRLERAGFVPSLAAASVPAGAQPGFSTPLPLAAEPPVTAQDAAQFVAPSAPAASTAPSSRSGAPARSRAPHRPLLPPLLQRMRGTEEWEALIGGRWMNRVGALALILGIGFFLKYAFDNNWISPALRVAIGVGIGLILLALAHLAQRRQYAIVAQGLVGAGVAGLYLSVYASSNLYHLVPPAAALGGMGLVTALGLGLALLYNSLAVALLAWTGGFVAIPLLGISAGSDAGLIGYLLLLDAGFIAIVLARDGWFLLEPLSLAATYLAYSAWYSNWYRSSKLTETAVSLTLFWLVFFAADALRLARRIDTHAPWRHATGAANAALYALAMIVLVAGHRPALGLIVLGLGAAHIGTVLALQHRLDPDSAVDARHALTALAAGTLAVPILTTGYLLPTVWALGALAVLWAGARWKLDYLWQPAQGIYALAAATLLIIQAIHSDQHLVPVLNLRALAYAVLTTCCAAAGIAVARLPDTPRRILGGVFDCTWTGLPFLLLSTEVSNAFQPLIDRAGTLDAQHLRYISELTLAVVWLAYGAGVCWVGLRRKQPWVVGVALGGSALAVVLGLTEAAQYQPLARYTPVLNLRVAAVLAVMALLGVQAWLLHRHRSFRPWIGSTLAALAAAILFGGFELLTAEIHDAFARHIGPLSGYADADRTFLQLMVLAAVWTVYSLPLVHRGLHGGRRTTLVLGLTSLGLAVLAAAWGGAAYIPRSAFTLVLALRPLVLASGMAALLVVLHWLRTERPRSPRLEWVLIAAQVCTVLLGFELLGTETRDIFGHSIAAQASASAQDTLRNLEQLTLSIAWLLYAIVLMVVGLWRRARWLRFGSLGLFGIVVLKIFAYDLSFLSPAYRSISFAGLGVILLGVSVLYQRYRSVILTEAV